MTRALSSLESKLVLHLEWAKQPVVTIEQTVDILGCSYNHARQVLHRLTRDRWLAPIRSGKYELIPAERGEHAFVDMNPLFLGSVLAAPYHFSFATAAFFHGLSTQASATTYIATTVGKSRRLIVRDKEYRIVCQPTYKFFGAVEVNAYGSQVMMAEPEKVIVDCLDRPPYAGGIPEIVGMVWRGKTRFDWNRFADYALQFQSQALVQRLGYLADLLELSMNTLAREKLLAAIGKSTPYLGAPKHWDTGGEYNAVWRVVDNIPRQILLADLEVR